MIADVSRTGIHRMPSAARRGEQGYVLIVFVLFAALLLVGLAAIIPKAAFEGRRDKEAELVFRGLQYHRAIQLFVRKFGRYPTSVDELTKTNNIRFLRKRYKDPMTKDGEWRLIHIGPSGVLLDAKTSLAPPAGSVVPGQTPGSNPSAPGGTPAGTSPTSTFQTGGGFQSSSGFSLPTPPGSGSNEPALSPSANPGANPALRGAPGASGQGQQVPGSTPSAANPQPILQPGSTTGGQQILVGGPIAGFASLSTDASIRTWNGYTEYDKWEFIYDPRQDQLGQAALARTTGGNQPGGAPQQQLQTQIQQLQQQLQQPQLQPFQRQQIQQQLQQLQQQLQQPQQQQPQPGVGPPSSGFGTPPNMQPGVPNPVGPGYPPPRAR